MSRFITRTLSRPVRRIVPITPEDLAVEVFALDSETGDYYRV